MNLPTAFGYRADAAAFSDGGSSSCSRYAVSDSISLLVSVVAKCLAFKTFGDLRWSSCTSSATNLAKSPPSNFRYSSSSSRSSLPIGSGTKNIVKSPIFIRDGRVVEPETVRRRPAFGKRLPGIPRSRFFEVTL